MEFNYGKSESSIGASNKNRCRRGLWGFGVNTTIAVATIAAASIVGGWAFRSAVRSAEAQAVGGSGATLPPDPSEVEPISQTGNNTAHPTWGSAGEDLIRLGPAAGSGGTLARSGDQSPRAISNLVNNQADPAEPSQTAQTVDQHSVSDFGYAFGQFMDHDMDHTPNGGASVPIPVAPGDPIGPAPLPFTRSTTDPANGQPVNIVTSYLDLSQVYGSTAVVADALRAHTGGLLKSSPGNMLPYDNSTYFTAAQIKALDMENDPRVVPESQLFAAGDARANENVELTALETLFMRNHNRLAAHFAAEYPNWTDEQVYQEARKLNIAQYQAITYNEWIPAIFGPGAMPPYKGYNPTVRASIANEFSALAFRFGHSMVSPGIARDGNDGQAVADDVELAIDFFDSNLLNPNGVVDPATKMVSTDIGPILKADADGNSQNMDALAINDVRNLLFGNGIPGGQDLIALDIQRGRDHQLPDYNTLRAALGLPRVTSFDQISSDDAVVLALQKAYPGGVNTIDPFEGGVAEDHVPGADVGPLFWNIMVNQFRRLRDGDRFWYQNEKFSQEESQIFQQGDSLSKVIKLNTNITNLQPDVFIFTASISGTITLTPPATSAGSPPPPQPVPPITVTLEDTSGDVLATTTADDEGNYNFDQLSGPSGNPEITPGVSATGAYVVVITLPSGYKQTSANPDPIEITRGGIDVTEINFTISAATPSPRHRFH